MFKKGHKKMGGRQKGTPNRKAKVLDLLKELGIEPIQEIVNTLPEVNGIARINVMLDLAQYCYPKLKALEVDIEGEVEVSHDADPAKVQELIEAIRCMDELK